MRPAHKEQQTEQSLVPQVLPPEVALEANPTQETLQLSELEGFLASARISQIAKEELERRGETKAPEHALKFYVKNLYRDDDLIFDAEASRRVFATLPSEALRATYSHHRDRQSSTKKIGKQSNQEELYGIYEELIKKVTNSRSQQLSRDLHDNKDYMQEMYLVFNKIVLEAPNSENFEGYLFQSLRNGLASVSQAQANSTRVRQSWRRPLVESDEKEGKKSDRFIHEKMAATALLDPTTPKLQDPTDRNSTVTMQDLPSVEDEAERSRVDELLLEENLRIFLQNIPYFTHTTHRSEEQAKFNTDIMIDTMRDYMQSDRQHGKNSQGIIDIETGHHLMSPERISIIQQKVLNANRGKNLSQAEIEALTDENIALQIQQYRSRGRTAIQEYLVREGYSKDEAKESIDTQAVLDAIEDAVQRVQ